LRDYLRDVTGGQEMDESLGWFCDGDRGELVTGELGLDLLVTIQLGQGVVTTV
jgi:hypothetical protein